jgi:hypothetical protein
MSELVQWDLYRSYCVHSGSFRAIQEVTSIYTQEDGTILHLLRYSDCAICLWYKIEDMAFVSIAI